MAEYYGDIGVNNRIRVFSSNVSIFSDFEFQAIELDYIYSGIGGGEETPVIRLVKDLPDNYALFHNQEIKKIIILKMNHAEMYWEGTDVNLFTHNGGFTITSAKMVTRLLIEYNLHIEDMFTSFNNWNSIKTEETWDLLSSKWEDINVDGKQHKLKWNIVRDFDVEKRTVTMKKELRNK